MHITNRAAQFARRLRATLDRSQIWPSFKDFALAYGIHHLTVMKSRSRLPAAPEPCIIYADAPKRFTDACGRTGLCPDHPLIAEALSRSEPFSSGDMWVVPVAGNGALRGVVLFGGLITNLSALSRSILHVIAHACFLRDDELESALPHKSSTLTPRERECLHWVAHGKTDAEIALILSLSPRTVRFHVENAKTKLRVKTRVHAVAQALKLQAITA